MVILPLINSVPKESMFDTIAGLPVHPLAIHFAAVLIPLSALAFAVMIFFPRFRKAYLPLVLFALGFSVVLAFVAKESGQALAKRVGDPGLHAELGDILFPASIGLFAAGMAWYLLLRFNRPKWSLQIAASVSILAVAGVVGLTYFVGHSGAEASWASRIAASEGVPLVPTTDSAKPSVEGAILPEVVAAHSSPSDCWTVIEGNVYDLSSFIQKHPGGAQVLESICGTDGSAAFSNQHSGQRDPARELKGLLLGPLASQSKAPSASEPKATQPAAATNTDPSAETVVQLTSAEVSKHDKAASCWSVVDGKVYDLTSYIFSHPGGASVLEQICGKDGSNAFRGQHGSSSEPNQALASLLIGPLVQ